MIEPVDKERQRIEDYRTTFATPSGQRVLADLTERFLYQPSAPHVCAGNMPGVVYIDGQRMLVRYLLRLTTMNVEEHLATFKTTRDQLPDPLGEMNGGESGYL